MKSFLRASGILTVIVGVLILIFYAVENYRGAKVWEETKAFLEGEGESLNFADLLPAMPPDEENFCAVPLIASMTDFEQANWDPNSEYEEPVYRTPEQHNRIVAMKLPHPDDLAGMPNRANFLNGDLPGLAAWAKIFRESAEFRVPNPEAPPAEQILSALERFDLEFGEMAEAASRSKSVFKIQWPVDQDFGQATAMQSPYLSEMNQLGKLLKLRAIAALATGKPDIARESVAIIFKFVQGLDGQPTLIHQMVAITNRAYALNVLWFGLYEQAWRAEDLLWFEDRLASFDSYDSALATVRSEMIIAQIYGGEYLKKGGFESSKAFMGLGGGDDFVMALFYWAFPDGWWDQGKSTGCRFYYDGFIRPLKAEDHSVLAGGSAVPVPEKSAWNLMSIFMGAGVEIVIKNFVFTRACERLAATACALERFHLETGAYPDSDLSELVPAFFPAVPPDLIDGKPVRFRKTPEGRYLIYSVGANLSDDGGIADFSSGRSKPDKEGGDWVWAYSFPEREDFE